MRWRQVGEEKKGFAPGDMHEFVAVAAYYHINSMMLPTLLMIMISSIIFFSHSSYLAAWCSPARSRCPPPPWRQSKIDWPMALCAAAH